VTQSYEEDYLADEGETTGVRRTTCMAVVKACACGLAYTQAAWEELEYVAIWTLDGVSLELRQCSCRSTISRRL
jgi:hypothetical protein